MSQNLIPAADLVPSVTSRVVTIDVVDMQEGAPANGSITFTLPCDLHVAADDKIIQAGSTKVTLVDGKGSIRLPTYDPDTQPTGWVLWVKKSWAPYPYAIRIPEGTAPISLADIGMVQPLPAFAQKYAITSATVNVTTGAAAGGSVSLRDGVLAFNLVFPPVGPHTHAVAEVAGLQSTLDALTKRGNLAADAKTVTGWSGSRLTLTAATEGADGVLTATASADGSQYVFSSGTGTGALPVTAGKWLTVGYDILDPVAAKVDSWVQWFDSAGVEVKPTGAYDSEYITTGQWTRCVGSWKVPTGVAFARILIGSAIRPLGTAVKIRRVLAECKPVATTGIWTETATLWDLPAIYPPAAFLGGGSGDAGDPMKTWATSLSQCRKRPVNIVAVGDSITEGTGASDIHYRWISRAQQFVRDAMGVPVGADFPFIPADYASTVPGQPVTATGNVTENTTTGLAWRSLNLIDATSKVVFTFTGTSAAVAVSKASSTGVMKVTVDGLAPVTYDTNNANGGGSGCYYWPVPGITTGGQHTVTIEWDSARTYSVILHGLATWNGDEKQGIRIHDAGHHGWGYQAVNQARVDALGNCLLPIAPDLIISTYGTNDIGRNDPAGYKAMAKAFLDAYHLRAPGVPILLVHMYRIAAHTEAQNDAYLRVLAELAAADPLVRLVNLREWMPDTKDPVTDPACMGLYGEPIHPNDAGYLKMAGIFARILTGRE